jgi:hypothetical protein
MNPPCLRDFMKANDSVYKMQLNICMKMFRIGDEVNNFTNHFQVENVCFKILKTFSTIWTTFLFFVKRVKMGKYDPMETS